MLTFLRLGWMQGREVFQRSPWHQLRHPLIFYYGHVAALYINKFRVAGLIQHPVVEELEQIMETGVDEMSWDDLSKNEMQWPDLRKVTEYRRTVYGIVKDVILNGDWSFPIEVSDPAWAIVMGFEHERIHLETSSVLMRELPAHLVTRPAAFPAYHPSAYDGSSQRKIQNEMIEVQGRKVKMGKPRDWRSFGWDNEYGTRTAEVATFSASKYLITNGEFLDFVRSGGYGNRAYWTEAGWQWRVFRNIHFPTFWCPDGPVRVSRSCLLCAFCCHTLGPHSPVRCFVRCHADEDLWKQVRSDCTSTNFASSMTWLNCRCLGLSTSTCTKPRPIARGKRCRTSPSTPTG